MSVACRDYEAKSTLDSYESAGLDNEVTEGAYEEQLAAVRMAEEALEARDAAGGRGRKRMPGALEGRCSWRALVKQWLLGTSNCNSMNNCNSNCSS